MTATQNLDPLNKTQDKRMEAEQIAQTSSPCSAEIWLLEFVIEGSTCSKPWCSDMTNDLNRLTAFTPATPAPSQPSSCVGSESQRRVALNPGVTAKKFKGRVGPPQSPMIPPNQTPRFGRAGFVGKAPGSKQRLARVNHQYAGQLL